MKCVIVIAAISLVSICAKAQVIVGDTAIVKVLSFPWFSGLTYDHSEYSSTNPHFFCSLNSKTGDVYYACSSLDTVYDTLRILLYFRADNGNVGPPLTIRDTLSAYGLPDTGIRIRPKKLIQILTFDTLDNQWHGSYDFLQSNRSHDSVTFGPWSLSDTNGFQISMTVTDLTGMSGPITLHSGVQDIHHLEFRSVSGSLLLNRYKSARLNIFVHSSAGDSVYSNDILFILTKPNWQNRVSLVPNPIDIATNSYRSFDTTMLIHLDPNLTQLTHSALHFPFSLSLKSNTNNEMMFQLSLQPVSGGRYRDTLFVYDTIADFQGGLHSEIHIVPIEANVSMGNEPPFWEKVMSGGDSNVTRMETDRWGNLFAFGHSLEVSTDEGITWSNISPPASATTSLGISPSGYLFAISNGLIYRSFDKGNSWQRLGGFSHSVSGVHNGLPFLPTSIAAPSDSSVYAETFAGTTVSSGPHSYDVKCHVLSHSADAGQTWSPGYDIWVNPTADSYDYFVVGDSGYAYADMWAGRSAIAFNREHRISAYDRRGIDTLGPLGFKIHHVSIATTGDIFVATDSGGVFRSNDSGKPFIGLNAGLPALRTSSIAVAPNGRAYVYVPGYGMYRSVVKFQKATVQNTSFLSPSPHTIVRDVLIIDSAQAVQIYDGLGREKACPLLRAGENIQIDARNLEPGFYFARSNKSVRVFLKL
jgi:hypothetical protein